MSITILVVTDQRGRSEATLAFDACELIVYPERMSPGNEWQVWLGLVGEPDRYETLPEYINYTIEQIEQQLGA